MLSLAQQLLDAKTDMPTTLGTSELRQLGAGVLRRSLFSARMSNADAVQGVREAVARMLSAFGSTSTDNLAEARLKLKQLGQTLGYDPKTGFPGEGGVEPAAVGSLRDLYSTERLNLILNTQERMAQGAAKNIWANEPEAREEYPAMELVRGGAAAVPRGFKRVKGGSLEEIPEDAWDSPNGRWVNACREAGDDDALRIFEATGRMVARLDSGVWQALGEGAGDYDDTLGNDYEPFAYNSLMVRVQVSASEFEELGGDPSAADEGDTSFGTGEAKVNKSRFDPDVLQTLKRGMETGALKFRVKVEVVE